MFPCAAAVFITLLCVVLATYLPELITANPAMVTVCVALTLCCGLCVFIIWRQPQSKETLTFKVTSHLTRQPMTWREPGPFQCVIQ